MVGFGGIHVSGNARVEAYRIVKSTTTEIAYKSKQVTVETDWFVPGLGSVKSVKVDTYYYDKTVIAALTWTLSLTGTNVVY
ncbi:MAG: hypothetical protein V3T30_06065 [Thermodesulfobacteriota bacterium]